MAILEAAIEVLKKTGSPMAVKDIYAGIIEQELYKFGAKSPLSVLSGTLRKHVTASATPRIVEVSSGVFYQM